MTTKFFVQIDDSFKTIENITNKNSLRASEDYMKSILETIPKDQLVFIVDKDTHFLFKDFKTAGDHPDCDIVLIDNKNVDEFVGKQLKNVYLFVDDECNLFADFQKIYKSVSGFIDLKVREINSYDLTFLRGQLNKICEVLYELDKAGSSLIVRQLNAYRIQTKFQEFGETDLFIGLDRKIYSHPSFYYQQDVRGILGNVKDFKVDELTFHFTRPHLICVTCNCFFCDRNIYFNKVKTNEFKVPSKNSCATTTFFSERSKTLFNVLMEDELFDSKENLDRVSKFDSIIAYRQYVENSVLANKVKKIDFSNRKLWSRDDHKKIRR